MLTTDLDSQNQMQFSEVGNFDMLRNCDLEIFNQVHRHGNDGAIIDINQDYNKSLFFDKRPPDQIRTAENRVPS